MPLQFESRAQWVVRALLDEGWRDWVAAGMIAAAPMATQQAQVTQPRQPAPQVQKASYADFFDALHQVEASGQMRPRDGDGGRAVGPFQIWKQYWEDAVRADPSLGGRYQDVRNYNYARKVVAAYMQKYAPRAWANRDFETLARIHNGGPKGYQKPQTEDYWERVKAELEK